MFETSAMKELHEIRERIYEKTKNMTRQEFIEYIRKKAEKVEEEMKRMKENKHAQEVS